MMGSGLWEVTGSGLWEVWVVWADGLSAEEPSMSAFILSLTYTPRTSD